MGKNTFVELEDKHVLWIMYIWMVCVCACACACACGVVCVCVCVCVVYIKESPTDIGVDCRV